MVSLSESVLYVCNMYHIIIVTLTQYAIINVYSKHRLEKSSSYGRTYHTAIVTINHCRTEHLSVQPYRYSNIKSLYN